MSFLAKGKKEDLKILAEEMGEVVDTNWKAIEIKNVIINSENYEEDFAKEQLIHIIEDRKKKERELEEEKMAKEKELERLVKEQEIERNRKEKELERIAIEKEQERQYELEKLKLQLEAQKLTAQKGITVTDLELDQPKFELKKLIPYFNPKQDDMGLFLNLFECQLQFLKLPDSKWVAYLRTIHISKMCYCVVSDLPVKNFDNSSVNIEKHKRITGKISILN